MIFVRLLLPRLVVSPLLNGLPDRKLSFCFPRVGSFNGDIFGVLTMTESAFGEFFHSNARSVCSLDHLLVFGELGRA